MSLEGKAITEYASLSGKIHTLVIDKTLSISGACADAKATGDRLEKMQNTIDNFDAVTDEEVQEMVDTAVDEHAKDTDNPHNVTAEQVGSYTKENADNKFAPKLYCQCANYTYINNGFIVDEAVAKTVTIPEGVTRVRCTVVAPISHNFNGSLCLNGTKFLTVAADSYSSNQTKTGSSIKIIDVTAGDVITAVANKSGVDSVSHFIIEAIEG